MWVIELLQNIELLDMDIKEIRENYKLFTDSRIEQIAKEEADSLRPEVIDILKSEIVNRNLDSNLLKCINTLVEELTIEEFDDLSQQITNHTCPTCNSDNATNISMVGEVISIILFTQYDKKIKIGCTDCLNKSNTKAQLKSSILGWWGFPFGIIQTLRSYIFNYNMRKLNASNIDNPVFENFIYENRGVLKLSKNSPSELVDLINRYS